MIELLLTVILKFKKSQHWRSDLTNDIIESSIPSLSLNLKLYPFGRSFFSNTFPLSIEIICCFLFLSSELVSLQLNVLEICCFFLHPGEHWAWLLLLNPWNRIMLIISIQYFFIT